MSESRKECYKCLNNKNVHITLYMTVYIVKIIEGLK